MTKVDYCFMMVAIFSSPVMGNSFRVLLATIWFIFGVYNIFAEVF